MTLPPQRKPFAYVRKPLKGASSQREAEAQPAARPHGVRIGPFVHPTLSRDLCSVTESARGHASLLHAGTGRFQAMPRVGPSGRRRPCAVRPAGQRKRSAVSSATYRTLLRIPGAAAFFLTATTGRLSIAMSSLGIMWLVHNRTGSYAVAGLVTGRFAVSEATSGPQLARLIDRFGQTPVLPPVLLAHAAAVVTLLTLVESGSPHGLMTARVPQGLPARQRCPGARWTRTAHKGASRSLRRAPSRWPCRPRSGHALCGHAGSAPGSRLAHRRGRHSSTGRCGARVRGDRKSVV